MKKTITLLVLCLTLGTIQLAKAEIRPESPLPTETTATNGVRFTFYGQIGNSESAEMVMNGNSGHYSYTVNGKPSGSRTLKFVSYNRKSKRLVLNAYANGKYIGKFDGRFDMGKAYHPEYGYIDAGSFYGKFISVKGIRISFYLYIDA